MKINPRRGTAAFTLIELMAVITIIVILAGLVIGGMGFVTDRQAKEKAKVQIALLSKALEDYKLDNGIYPPTEDSEAGTDNSKVLYNALFYVGASDAAKEKKIYIGELDSVSNKQGWTSGTSSATTKITDPWGYEYRYRTAVNSSGTANTSNQNPDFDLWSVSKDGKSDTSNPATTQPKNRDDIRNF